MVIAKNAELDWPLKRARSRTPKPKLRQLDSLGIKTVRDLLTYLPCKYEDRRSVVLPRDAHVGERQTFEGYIDGVRNDGQLTPGSGRNRQSSKLLDTYGDLMAWRDGLDLLWFGQHHLTARLHRGYRIRVHGTTCIDPSNGHLALIQPEIDAVDTPGWTRPAVNTARIVPIYDLAPGMLQTYHREIVWECLEHCHQQQPERSRPGYNDHSLSNIFWTLHFPREPHHPAQARAELAADELLETQIALEYLRRERETRVTGVRIPVSLPVAASPSKLPFTLTPGQEAAVKEIHGDLRTSGPPMHRVLQGDAGSGKMTVALRIILDVASADMQAILIAPTDVLAEQHMKTIMDLLHADLTPQANGIAEAVLYNRLRSFVVALLTPSVRATDRRRIWRGVGSGSVDLVIATPSVLDDQTRFRQLALAITTEQRDVALEPSSSVARDTHLLMLPIIPIPRPLQRTAYCDLAFSTIEPDPLSAPPPTVLALYDEREPAWNAIEDAVRNSHQAIVVCPLVEPVDGIPAASVSETRAALAERFPDVTIDVLHEQKSGREQAAVMRRFSDGQCDLLVSTSMIEPHVCCLHATAMVIVSAERFSMARLHRLRGCISQSPDGTCHLVATSGRPPSEAAVRRLKTVAETNDGLKLAAADLQFRNWHLLAGGPLWERSGLLQTGEGFDLEMLKRESAVADHILGQDPELKLPEHRALLAGRNRILERLQQAASGG